jgi:hypothetical protein
MKERSFRDWDKDWVAGQGRVTIGIKEIQKTIKLLRAVFGKKSPIVKNLEWAIAKVIDGKLAAEDAIYVNHFLKDEDRAIALNPRRLLDNLAHNLPSYMESDQDYVLNNLDLCVEMLDELLGGEENVS